MMQLLLLWEWVAQLLQQAQERALGLLWQLWGWFAAWLRGWVDVGQT